MARALLILPTGTYRAADFIEAAAALDAEVIVASEEDMVLADQLGDGFLLIDCSRPEESARRIVELGDRQPLDAIVPVDDQGVLIAALAAEQLGLTHNPPAAVAATRNKVMLRRALADAEIPQPAHELAGVPDDVAGLAEVIGYPVVLKPLSMSASRGVIRADDADEARGAAERIRRILAVAGHNPSEPILIEQYVPGIELAVEGVLRGGELEVLAFFDKPDPLEGPFFEETLFITPSRLHPEMLDEVERVAARAIRAIGLREGPVHAELRVDGSRVVFLEAAARSIGGLCGRSLRFGLLGTPLEVVLLRHALGRPHRKIRREDPASGVMMLPIPRAGILSAVQGTDRALEVPGVTEMEITIPPGRRVWPLPEADRYLGFLFARGPTPEDVEEALREGFACLDIVIDSD
ncbi:MAG: ATP-grasp domain-containing protein [Acidimicrobiia bacterium]|nr:ATP-grasp domain-containing protein [Acidimicrobiia bacterium]MDH3397058.1 ATP-grasp domain-containing protein [Acidimicrobiia bacterium]MDH5615110.1 ATP-grasp domain-containing protein [Acidimicrobiia bacterium]